MATTRENSQSRDAKKMDPQEVARHYKADPAHPLTIVINTAGRVEQVQLQGDAKIVNGKFVGDIGRGQSISLDYLPEIVTLAPGDTVGAYTISETTPTKDGRVEYTVTEGAETLRRVPKEVLEGIRITELLDAQLRQLTAEVQAMTGEKAVALQKRRADIQNVLTMAQSELSVSLKGAQAFTKKELAVFKKKVDFVLDRSSEALQTLQQELQKYYETEKRKVIVAGQIFEQGQKVEYTTLGGRTGAFEVHIDDDITRRAAKGNIVIKGKDARGNKVIFAVTEQAVRDRLIVPFELRTSSERKKDFDFKHFTKTEKELAEEEKKQKEDREEEIKEAKERHENRKRIADQVQIYFDTEVSQAIQEKLEEKLQEARDTKKSAHEADMVAYRTKLSDWDTRNPKPQQPQPGRQRGGRQLRNRKDWEDPGDPLPPVPPPLDLSAVRLSAKEKKEYTDDVTAGMVYDFIHDELDPSDSVSLELIKEIEARRKDRAAKEVRRQTRIEPGTDDYTDQYKMIVDVDVLKEIALDWTKKFEPPKEKEKELDEPFPEGELVFDLEKEMASIQSFASELRGMTEDAGGKVTDTISQLALDEFIAEVPAIQKGLAYIDDAIVLRQSPAVCKELGPARGDSVFREMNSSDEDTQRDALNKFRVQMVQMLHEKLVQIETNILGVQQREEDAATIAVTQQAEKDAEASIANKRKDVAAKETAADAEKKNERIKTVDMPAQVIGELLRLNHRGVGDIMTELYKGILTPDVHGRAHITADAQKRFAELFDGIPNPTDAMRKKLAEHGIVNWESFKQLWKEQISTHVAEVMHVAAEAKVKQLVAEKMSTLGSAWKKMKKIKGQIAARIGITALAVGGAAAGSAATFGVGTAAIIAGAAAGGGVRGLINTFIFGNKKMEERTQRLMAELQDEIRDEVIEAMDLEMAMNPADTTQTFSHILAQTTREVTSALGSRDDDGIAEVAALDVNARSLYEEALAGMEKKDVSETQKRDLAIAISRLSSKGELLTEETIKKMDKNVVSILDSLVSKYSGQRGIIPAIVSGAAIGTLLSGIRSTAESATDASFLSRAAMGGIFGAVAGLRYAERRRYNKERKESQDTLADRQERVLVAIDEVTRTGSASGNIRDIRADVARIEKMLGGKGNEQDILALTYAEKRGKEYKEKHGTAFEILVDQELVTKLKSIVHEARRAGIMKERAEDGHDLKYAMETLVKQGDAIQEEVTPKLGERIGSWVKKQGARAMWMTGGAVLGAGSAILVGTGVRWGAEKVGIIDASDVPVGTTSDIPAAEATPTVPSGEAGTGWVESIKGKFDALLEDVKTGVGDAKQAGGELLSDLEHAMSPEAQAERLGILEQSLGGEAAKGKNVLHLANSLEKNSEFEKFIVDREIAAHPEYKGLSPDQIIHKWRVGLAKDAGWDFKTRTFDKTPLFQVKDASGVTHTIEYKPFIKPDGTVGIKADDMFIREHGAKAFPEVPKPAVDAPVAEAPAVDVDQVQPVPRFVTQAFNGESWQFAENDLDERGRPIQGAVGMRMENGKPVYQQWNDTKPMMAGGKQIGFGGWDTLSSMEGSQALAASAGATPGNFDIGTYTNAKEHFGLSDSQLRQMENVGFVETTDGGVFVRDARGGIVVAGGDRSEQLTPTKPYVSVVESPAATPGEQTGMGKEKSSASLPKGDEKLKEYTPTDEAYKPLNEYQKVDDIEGVQESLRSRELGEIKRFLASDTAAKRFGEGKVGVEALRNYQQILAHRDGVYGGDGLHALMQNQFNVDMDNPQVRAALGPKLEALQARHAAAMEFFAKGVQDPNMDVTTLKAGVNARIDGLNDETVRNINSGEFQNTPQTAAALQNFEMRTLQDSLGIDLARAQAATMAAGSVDAPPSPADLQPPTPRADVGGEAAEPGA